MSGSEKCPNCGYDNPSGSELCGLCQDPLGALRKRKSDRLVQQAGEERRRAEQQAREERQIQKRTSLPLTTADLPEPYEVLDAIIALDSHAQGFFTSANPASAFDGVKRQLREKCFSLGGDAVVGCQFEYRVAVGEGLFGSKQVVEIFAYGTAVRLLVSLE